MRLPAPRQSASMLNRCKERKSSERSHALYLSLFIPFHLVFQGRDDRDHAGYVHQLDGRLHHLRHPRQSCPRARNRGHQQGGARRDRSSLHLVSRRALALRIYAATLRRVILHHVVCPRHRKCRSIVRCGVERLPRSFTQSETMAVGALRHLLRLRCQPRLRHSSTFNL